MDFLSWTFPGNPYLTVQEQLLETFHWLQVSVSHLDGYRYGEHGVFGYESSMQLYRDEMPCGILGAGGNGGTVYVQLTGRGCVLVDMPAIAERLRCLGARLTRIDLAHDLIDAPYLVDCVRTAYMLGEFGTGGRYPSSEARGNWDRPDGKGRTYYVGRRENGKMLRAYEKGRELGDPNSEWVRLEVEFRRISGRELPLSMLKRPAAFLAGSYACFGWISEFQDVLKRLKKTAQIEYAALLRYCRASYGQLINVVSEVEGSAEAALAKLRKGGVPRRLRYVCVTT